MDSTAPNDVTMDSTAPNDVTMDATPPNFNLQDSLLMNMPLLGLRLTKSLVEKRLSAMAVEKPKATNFPFTSISIGGWRRVSRREGDFTAKFYFFKRRLVWEFVDGGLKSKIEVLWDDITAINAYMPPNQPGTLQIELGKTPSFFFQEINPQPKTHANWEQASDFTGGHALHHRIHYVIFPQGVLDVHYLKLLQCDHNLFILSKRPFPSEGESPYFNQASFSQKRLPLNRAESPSLNPFMAAYDMSESEKSDGHQTVHLGAGSMANHHNMSFHEASFPRSSAGGSGQQLHVVPRQYANSRGQQLGMSLPSHHMTYMPPLDGGPPFLSTHFNQIQNGGGVRQINNNNNINWLQHPTLQVSNIYNGVTVEQPTLQGSNIYGGGVTPVELPELINYNNLGNNGANIQHPPFNQY